MSISNTIKDAVEKRNLQEIRGELWSCTVVDPSLTRVFQERLKYILSNGISEEDLFEVDDGTGFATEATQENLNALSGLFCANFSKKKYEAYKKMGGFLYPPQLKQETATLKEKPTERTTQHASARNEDKEQPFLDMLKKQKPIFLVLGFLFSLVLIALIIKILSSFFLNR